MSRRARGGAAATLLLGTALVALADAALGGRFVSTPVLTLVTVVSASLVGAWWPPRPAVLTLGAAAVLLTCANQLTESDRYTAANDLFFYAVLVGGVGLAGHLVSARAAQVRELRALSAQRAEQRAREVETARLEERTRLDAGVTRAMMQRMGAVVVQAAGARRESATTRDRDAVARVETAGRETLDELREVLGSLGEADPGAEAPVPPPRRPEPALGRVDLLVGCSGLPVVVECLDSTTRHGPVVATVLLGAALGVPLVWRRSRPLLACAGFLGLAILMSAWLTPLTATVTILLPMSIAAYALGAHTRGRHRLLALAALLVGGLLVNVADQPQDASDGLAPTLVWLVIAFGAGVVAAQHADRAQQLADLIDQVEAGREDDLRLAVAEQRQAIARDLHDTVAHAMTIVCLHAEAAQQQWSDAATVEQAMATVEQAAREAMGHLRTGLGVLETQVATHEEGGELGDDVAAFAASLGVPVTVMARTSLSPTEHALVRRVVREALVNVARHAKGVPATVEVTRAEGLTIRVSNAPGGAAARGQGFSSGAGRGLAGLGELLGEHGGSVEHGPTSGGGYAVTAHLPTEPVTVPA